MAMNWRPGAWLPLLLVACAGGGGEPTPSPAPATPAQTPSPTGTAASAGTKPPSQTPSQTARPEPPTRTPPPATLPGDTPGGLGTGAPPFTPTPLETLPAGTPPPTGTAAPGTPAPGTPAPGTRSPDATPPTGSTPPPGVEALVPQAPARTVVRALPLPLGSPQRIRPAGIDLTEYRLRLQEQSRPGCPADPPPDTGCGAPGDTLVETITVQGDGPLGPTQLSPHRLATFLEGADDAQSLSDPQGLFLDSSFLQVSQGPTADRVTLDSLTRIPEGLTEDEYVFELAMSLVTTGDAAPDGGPTFLEVTQPRRITVKVVSGEGEPTPTLSEFPFLAVAEPDRFGDPLLFEGDAPPTSADLDPGLVVQGGSAFGEATGLPGCPKDGDADRFERPCGPPGYAFEAFLDFERFDGSPALAEVLVVVDGFRGEEREPDLTQTFLVQAPEVEEAGGFASARVGMSFNPSAPPGAYAMELAVRGGNGQVSNFQRFELTVVAPLP